MQHVTTISPTNELQTIADVEKTLRRMEQRLSTSHLQAVGNFNRAYLIITKNVHDAVRHNRFKHTTFLNMFDTTFASYYIAALQQYAATGSTVPAWQIAFERSASTSPVLTMALGVNAHVNNDIPQVLKDCSASHTYRADYNLVNSIISDSIEEVLQSLDHDTAPLSPKRTVLVPAYGVTMKTLIKRWRKRAWNNFLALQGGSLSEDELEQQAAQIADRLTCLPL
jgi:hypothetical protein